MGWDGRKGGGMTGVGRRRRGGRGRGGRKARMAPFAAVTCCCRFLSWLRDASAAPRRASRVRIRSSSAALLLPPAWPCSLPSRCCPSPPAHLTPPSVRPGASSCCCLSIRASSTPPCSRLIIEPISSVAAWSRGNALSNAAIRGASGEATAAARVQRMKGPFS